MAEANVNLQIDVKEFARSLRNVILDGQAMILHAAIDAQAREAHKQLDITIALEKEKPV